MTGKPVCMTNLYVVVFSPYENGSKSLQARRLQAFNGLGDEAVASADVAG